MGNHTVLSRGNASNYVNPTVLSRENKGNFVNGFYMDHYVNEERSVWVIPESHNDEDLFSIRTYLSKMANTNINSPCIFS